MSAALSADPLFDLQKGCFPENLDRDAAGDRKRPCLHNIPADIQQTECKFWRRNNELSTYGNLAVFGTNFYEYYQLDESESPVDVIGSVSLPLESGKQYELRIPFPRTVYSTVLWCIFLSGNGHNLRGRYHGWRQTGSYPLVFLCIVDGRQCTVLVRLVGKYLLHYSTAAGVLQAAAVLFGNVQSTTSYRAYRMWKNGWAQAYGAGWEDRLKVLKDDSVKNPVFTPLNYVELIMYTDLQPEDGYVWVNSACAEYYGKESVTVVEGE